MSVIRSEVLLRTEALATVTHHRDPRHLVTLPKCHRRFQA
jgi:hypothetical protein